MITIFPHTIPSVELIDIIKQQPSQIHACPPKPFYALLDLSHQMNARFDDHQRSACDLTDNAGISYPEYRWRVDNDLVILC